MRKIAIVLLAILLCGCVALHPKKVQRHEEKCLAPGMYKAVNTLHVPENSGVVLCPYNLSLGEKFEVFVRLRSDSPQLKCGHVCNMRIDEPHFAKQRLTLITLSDKVVGLLTIRVHVAHRNFRCFNFYKVEATKIGA